MVKLNEINRTATFAWSNDPIPVLATGTAAGVIDDDFSSSSSLSFHSIYDREPILTLDVEAKFNDLDWSKSNQLLAGALENGTVQFWNTEKLGEKKVTAAATGSKHTGSIKAIQFNPTNTQFLATGGSNSEVFIWDTTKLTNLAPFAPGAAMTHLETVTSLSWNTMVPHIFAAGGSGNFASIWDLNSKREVLQLKYEHNNTRCVLSSVAWHPSTGTKLITASESDGAPVILTWDLRNSNAPSSILEGHKKGILSIDWNTHDTTLLLSCGKDNTSILWNPESGEKLAQYPTTANWAFKTRFAPQAPDVFATSSFDKKVVIQTIQDTSPAVNKALDNKTDNEFWNEISTTETQHPQYFVKQAPNWYGRHSSVAFGFGGKIVTVAKTGAKTSSIEVKKAPLPGSATNEKLVSALDSGDFKSIIETQLEGSYEGINKPDWELLSSLEGESDLFEKFVALKLSADAPSTQEGDKSGEAFFTDLNEHPKYAPSGEFSFTDDSKDLTQALLQKKLNKAVDISLNEDKLVEALMIALNGPQELKDKVSNYYFNKFAGENSVSRLLYSITLDDMTDVVNNTSVDNWKEIATAVKTYSTPATAKAHFNTLGDRVLAADPIKNRESSIINYISASALDKVAEIWNSELKTLETKILETEQTSAYDAHFAALSEFVEKFSAYRSTFNLEAPIVDTSSTLTTILEYISIISTNGQFELASKFLALLPDDVPAVKLEKERIIKATTTNHQTAAASSRRTQAGNRYGSLATPATTTGYPTIPPVAQAQTQIPRAVPSSNPYLPNAGVTPASPAAPSYGYPQQSMSQSPYAPKTSLYAAPVNPYMPVTQAAPAAPATPAEVPPPPKARKHETEGWNDLPSHFHQQPSRRATPAATAVASVVSPPTNGSIPLAPPALNRNTSFAAAPSMPPPPRSVSKSRKTPTLPEAKPVIPQQNSRYAPASPQPNISSLTNAPAVGGYGVPPPPMNGTGVVAPPKNPYAPAAGSSTPAPVSNPYAPSVPQMGGSQYGVPPAQSAPVVPPVNNPYAPQAANPYAPPAQAPAANPYAPSAQQLNAPAASPYAPQQVTPAAYGGVTSPYGAAPPHAPPKTFAPPPKGPAGPPKSHPTGAPLIQQDQPPAAPQQEKYPAGDRSHIPEENKKIYEVFDSSLKRISPLVPEQFGKQVTDTEKRLNFLYDHLNNQDLLTAPTLQLLDNLCDAIVAKDYSGALSLHLNIMTNHGSEVGNWAVGVKRLVQFCEATDN